MKVNNSKKYTKEEKELLIKGMQMAIDRINTAYADEKYLEQVGFPPLTLMK